MPPRKKTSKSKSSSSKSVTPTSSSKSVTPTSSSELVEVVEGVGNDEGNDEDVMGMIKLFFGSVDEGNLSQQMYLFNRMIAYAKLDSGILAITAHNPDACDEECLFGAPSVRILSRMRYMSELFEDLWWTDKGTSDIFCKRADEVTDVGVYIDLDTSGARCVVYTAKIKKLRIAEKVIVAIVYNERTRASEYHIIEPATNPNDNHPVFSELTRDPGVVAPERRMMCTHYSLKHFIDEFGESPTHVIDNDHFIPIN